MNDRNLKIKLAINKGKKPVLEYEYDLLEKYFFEIEKGQSKLSADMREVMSQSSETYHDNAPAEAICEESKQLSALAKQTKSFLQKAIKFNFDSSSKYVTLGSVCLVKYEDEDDPVYIFLSGTSYELPKNISSLLPDGCNTATINSPLGKAILGATTGSIIKFCVNERNIKIKIIEIKSIIS